MFANSPKFFGSTAHTKSTGCAVKNRRRCGPKTLISRIHLELPLDHTRTRSHCQRLARRVAYMHTVIGDMS